MGRSTSGRVTAAQRRKTRLQAKHAEENRLFHEAQQQLQATKEAVTQLDGAVKVRAGRVAAIEEEMAAEDIEPLPPDQPAPNVES